VTRFRLSWTVHHLGVLTAVLALALSADAAAESTSARKPSSPAKKLTLAQTTQSKPTYSAANAKARRTSVARSRAAANAKALRDAQEPRFKLDENGALVPDLRAEAAIIYDSATGHVLWELNSNKERSIASITKVMTAAVFMEDSPNLSDVVTVNLNDVRSASTTYLRSGYQVTKGDLLRYYAQQIEDAGGFETPLAKLLPGEDTRSVLRPYGVFAVVAPFNFPLALAAGMAGGALVAGNAVVFKPSSEAPLTGLRLCQILNDAGLQEHDGLKPHERAREIHGRVGAGT